VKLDHDLDIEDSGSPLVAGDRRSRARVLGSAMLLSFLLLGCGRGIDCPADMVALRGESGPFCIHRFEVRAVGDLGNQDQGSGFPDGSTRVKLRSRKGDRPTLATWYQAYAACQGAGFSLCTSRQWEDACDGVQGQGGQKYPTEGSRTGVGVCAIGDLSDFTKVPLSPSGAYSRCHTKEGVYDLMGNLWEWADPQEKDALGLPRIDKRGGAHYGAEPVPCTYGSPGSHAPSFDGTIGFRCCATPNGG